MPEKTEKGRDSPGVLPNPNPLGCGTQNVVLMDLAGGPAGGALRTVENNMALDCIS